MQIAATNTMDQSATTVSVAPHPPTTINNNNNTKQGFRFHKSGSVSPIPPPSQLSIVRPPSAPPALLISSSEATTTTSTATAADSNNNTSTPTPVGVDPKLYQIVKRIVASTPSLLVNGKNQ